MRAWRCLEVHSARAQLRSAQVSEADELLLAWARLEVHSAGAQLRSAQAETDQASEDRVRRCLFAVSY